MKDGSTPVSEHTSKSKKRVMGLRQSPGRVEVYLDALFQSRLSCR